MIKIKIEAQNGADLRNQLKQLLGETSEPQAFELKPISNANTGLSPSEHLKDSLIKELFQYGYNINETIVQDAVNEIFYNRTSDNISDLIDKVIAYVNVVSETEKPKTEDKPKKQRTTRKKAEEKTPEPEPEETNEAEAEVAPMPEENEETEAEAEVAPMPEESEETSEDQPKVTMAEIQTKVQGLVKDGKKPAIIKILENDFKVSRVPDIKESDLPKFYVLISKL